MKRKKAILLSAAVLIAIIAILIYNKSRMTAEAKTDVMTAIPVTVTTAGNERVTDKLSLTGVIAANNDVPIVAETQGKITAVHAEVGQHVGAGDVLLQVDDEVKQAALASAEINNEKAGKDLERFESLAKQNAATDQQLEGARLAAKAAEAQYIVARRQFNDTRIKSPIPGIVTARLVDVGAYVQSGNVVANVVDISRLKVKVNVAERDVFRMKVGDEVTVGTDVYPGVTFNGKIATISSKADESHTYPVEVRLANSPNHPLKAGMFGTVNFNTAFPDNVVTIPREALVGSAKDAMVFVVDGPVAKLRNLVIGGEYDTKLVVLSGLGAGETIVINGQNNLRDNSAVTIIK